MCQILVTMIDSTGREGTEVKEIRITLYDIWTVIKRYNAFIAKITMGAMLIALAISFTISPTYEAETDVRIKQSRGIADSLLANIQTDLPLNSTQLYTYAAIIKSRAVVETVISKTQSDKEFVPSYEAMLGQITIVPIKNTEILQIKVRAASPEEAQLVANTLVDTIKERLTELVRAEQIGVREFIGERLQESKSELDHAEALLAKYKREQKMAAPTEQTRAVVEKLSAIDKLSAENKVAMAMAQGRLSTAERQLASQQPGFIADSPLIQQLKGKLAELEVQLVTISQTRTEQHPEVIALRAGIDDTRKMLNAEISRIVKAEAPSANPIHQRLLESKLQAEADIAAASSQQGAIQRVTSDGERDLTKLPAKEQGLLKLTRDASVAQELNIMLAKRYEEARIAEVMQPTDLQVIDVAALPTRPVSPNKTRNALFGAILGMMGSIGFIIYREYMNRVIRNVQDAKMSLGHPVLASIPDFETAATTETESLWFRIKHALPKFRFRSKGC